MPVNYAHDIDHDEAEAVRELSRITGYDRNPYQAPPVKCHCESEINICPLCVGGLMPLVYALVLYGMYHDLGWSRTVSFARYAAYFSMQLFSFGLLFFSAAAFLFASCVLIYCVVAALVRAIASVYAWFFR